MRAADRGVMLGLVQSRASDAPEENLARALAGIEAAASRGADVVCLQELFLTPYFCRTQAARLFDLAEPIPGPTSDALAQAARLHGVAVIGSLFERRADGLCHNSALLYDRTGALRSVYRKMHIPDDPGFYEKYYFAPGDAVGGFRAVDVGPLRVGPLVCWDQWYPEAARITSLHGAQLLVYPTAIGRLTSEDDDYAEAQRTAWETMQRAHAIANGVFVAAVNRVGTEGEIEFWGSSFVFDPFGRLLARAGRDEEVLVVRLDLSLIEETRREWPFLRDRRVDAYGGITARWLGESP